MPLLGMGFSHNGGFDRSATLKAIREKHITLIDTAKRYRTEKDIGSCIRDSGVARDTLFVCSKLWPGDIHHTATDCGVRTALEESLRKLGLKSLELYFIHWPDCQGSGCKDHKKARQQVWKEMENCVHAGLTKSIGVSNFQVKHLEDILETCKIIPAVNQIEYNPMQNPKELIEFCKNKKIVIQGWSPLAKGDLLDPFFWTKNEAG
eukprot:UN24913